MRHIAKFLTNNYEKIHCGITGIGSITGCGMSTYHATNEIRNDTNFGLATKCVIVSWVAVVGATAGALVGALYPSDYTGCHYIYKG